MNLNSIIKVIIGVVVGAGGMFAYDDTKDACDGLPERPAIVETIGE